MNANQKPVRVETSTVRIFTCPVCQEDVTGTVEVAIRLGTMTMDTIIEEDGDRTSVAAQVSTTTELRGLDVRHRCSSRGDVAVPTPDVMRGSLD